MASKPKSKAKRPQSMAVRPQMVSASRSSSNLASLKATTMMSSKTALPAEIMAMVLDYLPVPDLMHVAQTSKRMQEMVYDDTRWVTKLREMEIWNEAEARQRAEVAMKRKMEGHVKKGSANGMKNGAGHAGVNGVQGQTARRRSTGPTAENLIDTGFEEQNVSKAGLASPTSATDSFATSLDALPPTAASANLLPSHLAANLLILKSVKSIRGGARLEYSKAYGALAPYYVDIARSPIASPTRLSRDYSDPVHQAVILGQLLVFSKSDTTSDWQHREQALHEMVESNASNATAELENAYASQDYERMARQVSILFSLDREHQASGVFLRINNAVRRKHLLGDPLDCLNHALEGQVNLNPSADFFKRLSVEVCEQLSIMAQTYPSVEIAMSEFIKDVRESINEPYITKMFSAVEDKSSELYLRVVSGVFLQCDHFWATIRRHDLPKAKRPDRLDNDTREALLELFTHHAERYLQCEIEFCTSRMTAEVQMYEKQVNEQEAMAKSYFMSQISKPAKRDFMASFKNLFKAPTSALPSLSKKPADAAAKQPSRPETPTPPSLAELNGSSMTRSASPIPQSKSAPTTEMEAMAQLLNSNLAGINALFSIEVAIKLVQHTKISIERASPMVSMISPGGPHAREKCEEIFRALVHVAGYEHIKPGFDKALDHLKSYSARQAKEHKSEEGIGPLVTFLELVSVGDLITQMIDVFYHQELVAKGLTDKDDFLNPTGKDLKKFVAMMDTYVSQGLDTGMQVLLDEVEYIFGSTLQPTDYNPGGAISSAKTKKAHLQTSPKSTADNAEPTEAAKQVVTVVRTSLKMLEDGGDKKLIDTFIYYTGNGLFNLICKQLKRQRISVDGAQRLTADLNHFRLYIATLKMKDLNDQFEALSFTGEMFMVDGNGQKQLATIITDKGRYKGVFRTEEVLEFAERRADWYAIKGGVEKYTSEGGCSVM